MSRCLALRRVGGHQWLSDPWRRNMHQRMAAYAYAYAASSHTAYCLSSPSSCCPTLFHLHLRSTSSRAVGSGRREHVAGRSWEGVAAPKTPRASGRWDDTRRRSRRLGQTNDTDIRTQQQKQGHSASNVNVISRPRFLQSFDSGRFDSRNLNAIENSMSRIDHRYDESSPRQNNAAAAPSQIRYKPKSRSRRSTRFGESSARQKYAKGTSSAAASTPPHARYNQQINYLDTARYEESLARQNNNAFPHPHGRYNQQINEESSALQNNNASPHPRDRHNQQSIANTQKISFNSNYSHRHRNPEIANLLAKINACQRVDDIVQVAHDNLDNFSPHAQASFWKKFCSLLGKSIRNTTNRRMHHEKQSTNNHHPLLHDVFHRTLHDGFDEYNPSNLSSVAQSAATIVKSIAGQGRRRFNNDPFATTLYKLLVSNGIPFWERVQERSLTLMDAFRPKFLVSVAWSFATIHEPMARGSNGGRANKLLDVSPFFRALHTTYNSRRGEFTSKHAGNLAWSCATCRQTLPLLLDDFAGEFVRRRNIEKARNDGHDSDDGNLARSDGLDPMTLCQWANAFAKAGYGDRNTKLFRSISDAAIPMLGSDFEARHFANLAHACAVAGVVPGLDDGSLSLFDEIAMAAIPKVQTFNSQNIANVMWAYAKMEENNPALFDALASEAKGRLSEFSSKQLANLAWSLSKFPPEASDEIFDCIANDVTFRGFDSFTSQGLAMLAHSFATVGHVRNSAFWDALDEAATARSSELGPVECSQIAWSFATTGRPADDLFHGIKTVVLSNMSHIQPQGISNIAWAFAMQGYDSRPFFEAIATQSLQRLGEFTPQDRIMLILAFSRISHPFPEIFAEVVSVSVSQLDKFSGLDLFNMVISYVKTGHGSEPWLKAIASEIVRRPSALPPRTIVGIAWAYSFEGIRIPALLETLSNECIAHCDKLESKEVASLAWSFASIEYFHQPLLSRLAETSHGRWQDFDASSLANMAWAYATAGEDRRRLFEGIAEAAIPRIDEFSSQGVSMLLWACSVVGHFDSRLFDLFAPRAKDLLHECNCQSLANIAWAYAVADVDADPLFGSESRFIDTLAEKIDEFDQQGLSQLHQWNLWRKETGAEAFLASPLREYCHVKFASQPIVSSQLQKDVFSELVSIGMSPEEEFETQSGYHLDMLIKVNGKNLGVEVDGPHHFIGRKPTGSTVLKHRQISKVDGIQVVSLPYWELNKLQSSDEKKRYLRAKLGI